MNARIAVCFVGNDFDEAKEVQRSLQAAGFTVSLWSIDNATSSPCEHDAVVAICSLDFADAVSPRKDLATLLGNKLWVTVWSKGHTFPPQSLRPYLTSVPRVPTGGTAMCRLPMESRQESVEQLVRLLRREGCSPSAAAAASAAAVSYRHSTLEMSQNNPPSRLVSSGAGNSLVGLGTAGGGTGGGKQPAAATSPQHNSSSSSALLLSSWNSGLSSSTTSSGPWSLHETRPLQQACIMEPSATPLSRSTVMRGTATAPPMQLSNYPPVQQQVYTGLDLIRAASTGNLGLVKECVTGKSPVDINFHNPSDGDTALHRAAKHCHEHIVVWLVDNKADIAAKNLAGKTPREVSLRDYEALKPKSKLLKLLKR